MQKSCSVAYDGGIDDSVKKYIALYSSLFANIACITLVDQRCQLQTHLKNYGLV